MTAKPEVIPVFVVVPDAAPRDVLPALARLLIDMARRQKLANEGSLIMLEESSPVAPLVVSPCPTQN